MWVQGSESKQITKNLGHILSLERFPRGKNLSRFTLEPAFWRPCGECLERAEREAGNPGRRRKKQ